MHPFLFSVGLSVSEQILDKQEHRILQGNDFSGFQGALSYKWKNSFLQQKKVNSILSSLKVSFLQKTKYYFQNWKPGSGIDRATLPLGKGMDLACIICSSANPLTSTSVTALLQFVFKASSSMPIFRSHLCYQGSKDNKECMHKTLVRLAEVEMVVALADR